MELFKINRDLTYEISPIVKKNVFIDMPTQNGKLPRYEEIFQLLPAPIWTGYESVIECYNYTWKTAFCNLKLANGDANFVSDYIDTAFNGFLFMWDSSFIVMFGKYGARAFNFQKTLDNFYSHQHKDGFICRELCEDRAGEQFARHDPSSTGPNILGWAEWEYYLQTGDADRLQKVFDPLLAYHLWLKEHRTWRDGTYWSTGWGCGMDNQPRLQSGDSVEFSHGHMAWLDICVQQVLSAKILVEMSRIIGRGDDENISALRDEVNNLTQIINEKLWNEEDAFYYDLWKNGEQNGVKSVGAYWALLADIVPKERLDRFVAHLDNEREFNRPFRVPTLSADHPEYRADGGYWRGGVWAPTNYMVLRGLEKNGYEGLAYDIARNCLDNIVSVFEKDGTVYENYSPETPSAGNPSKPDFIGWSGLFSINILFEYVFGIRPLAREKKIIWNINLTEKHGVRNYPLGDLSVDLICEERASEDDDPIIIAHCDEPVEIEIRYNGKEKTVFTSKGE